MNTVFRLLVEGFVNRFLPSAFWSACLVGDYGVLTLGVSNALLTVLPILSIYFMLFNMLEDSGYVPNLCVLLKRLSEKVGLTGNAIMPVTLAFGCKTMATLTTKCLRSGKEKFIAVYLIAFGIPCAAQMALNMSILGGLGIWAFAIAFSFMGLTWVTVGLLLNRLLKDGLREDFIQELPEMRVPNMRAVLKKTFYKLKDFLREAMPIFISAAVILFVADKTGVLTVLKNSLRPIITGFLGLPLQMVDVIVLCIANRELAAGMLIKIVQKGVFNYVQCIVAVTFTMMFIPCLANVIAMVKVQGLRKAFEIVLCINITAILLAGLLNWLLAGVAGL
jgi:ferrous iron transport protein B